MSTIVKTSDPTVQRIVNATFPSFRGKSVDVNVADSVRFWGTYWDDGYKRDYRLVRLADMKAAPITEIPFHALRNVSRVLPSGSQDPGRLPRRSARALAGRLGHRDHLARCQRDAAARRTEARAYA